MKQLLYCICLFRKSGYSQFNDDRFGRALDKLFEADREHTSTITNQGRIDVGDCVTIERGDSANIRRVSEVHCQAKDTRPSAEHAVEAKECEAAKAAMLDAETTEALEAAVDKVRILCEE